MRGWKQAAGRAFLVLWLPSMAFAVGTLMINHVAALPAPGDLGDVQAGVAALPGQGAPRVVHIIDERCSCTDGLLRHLFSRGAIPGLHEQIRYVGQREDRLSAARAAGFEIEAVAEEAVISGLGIDAAPVLILADADGEVRYVGGYFDRPAAVSSLDVGLIRQWRDGEPAAPLPIFGCAVSASLRAQRDPLRLQ